MGITASGTGAEPVLTVLHVIRPQPRGRIGGADLHIADLAGAQRLGASVRPIVLSLGNPDYRALLAARGVPQIAPRLPLSPRGLWALGGEIVARGVRLLHSHGYESDYLALALSRRTALPLVTTSHGMITEGWVLRAKTWLDLRCLRFAQEVIASSAREARLLEDAGRAARVRYIPNGIVIDPEGVADDDGPPVRAELGLPERAPVLAFVGRLAPEKRVDLFLESAALVARRRPDARFLVIGSGAELERSRSLAARLGIAERVRFTGLRWDVARLLTAADVLVCSSDTEGTPRAVLEAMAHGAVVVATAVGGVPDLVEDGRSGLLVPAGDAAALARASIVALDPERAAALRATARARVREHHSVAGMATATEAVYRDAVARFTAARARR